MSRFRETYHRPDIIHKTSISENDNNFLDKSILKFVESLEIPLIKTPLNSNSKDITVKSLRKPLKNSL